MPFDAAKGEDGVSFQGSLLIAMLFLIGVPAWRGMEDINEGANRWTWIESLAGNSDLQGNVIAVLSIVSWMQGA